MLAMWVWCGGDNHGPFGTGLNLGTLWGKIARGAGIKPQ